MRNLILAASLLIFPLTFAHAEPLALFSSSDDIEHSVAEAIHKSQLSIDVAMYGLTSEWLMKSLKEAAARGVTVRLLVDENGLNEKLRNAWQHSENLSLETLQGRYPGQGLMHHKFAIFDNGSVLTGSYNWTNAAARLNYDNAIWEDDPDVVRSFGGEFEKLWAKAHAVATDGSVVPQLLKVRIGAFKAPSPATSAHPKKETRHASARKRHRSAYSATVAILTPNPFSTARVLQTVKRPLRNTSKRHA